MPAGCSTCSWTARATAHRPDEKSRGDLDPAPPESMTDMGWSPDPDALRGRIAVVAGATRGAGRGIAAALGEAGATVICTGRSTRLRRSDYNRPETIEETAELVTRLAGTGIAVRVGHRDPDRAQRLAARLRQAHGHVDVPITDLRG